ncbi:MAG TPA: electron transfer flavoprotein subunit beta/FixA family protein [Candidatus Brocadiia bacterium]|nr:electron transfer flavoprotein subunit beta/FixA family protein [Candidatus Brocadiia bacterium]
MRIIVFIKQVPETSNVKMDPVTGVMVRDGVESIVNPLDLYSVETALQLRDRLGGKVTAVSMGPKTAIKAIKEVISMGCDDGILISDKAFAGSDTHATSYALSRALSRLAPFDLALTGVRATDGDTGQVGPGIASFLDLPFATDVSAILNASEKSLEVERLTESGYASLRMPLPCLISVVKEISNPRLPTLKGKQRARQMDIPAWTAADLEADEKLLGLNGSPTRVVKIDRPKVTRSGVTVWIEKTGAEEAARQLADFLEKRNLL